MSEDVTPQSIDGLRALLQKYGVLLHAWPLEVMEALWLEILQGQCVLSVLHGQLLYESHYVELRVSYRDASNTLFRLVQCSGPGLTKPQHVLVQQIYTPDIVSKAVAAKALGSLIGLEGGGNVAINPKTQIKKRAHMQRSEKSGPYVGLRRQRHATSYEVELTGEQYQEQYMIERDFVVGGGQQEDTAISLFVWVAD